MYQRQRRSTLLSITGPMSSICFPPVSVSNSYKKADMLALDPIAIQVPEMIGVKASIASPTMSLEIDSIFRTDDIKDLLPASFQ